MKDEICRAFCEEIRIREVPAGLAIGTAFRRADGDAIGFYVIKNSLESNLARLEDDGTTIPYLEAAGVDFDTQTRQKAFSAILEEYGAHYDLDEAVIRTPDMPEHEIARASIGFAALLLRLSDFLLLSQEHVESAFKDDAKKRIKEAIGTRAKIEDDAAVSDHLSEVKPDLLIRAPNREPVAIFLAQSAQRVNDAIFLQMAALYESREALSVIALLEGDSSISSKLRQRASNRLTALPVYRHDEAQAIQRIVREAVGAEGLLH
ncbi:DUF1828 domain-containing protein [Aquabacter spiritensis]|uniref:Uncharacterized protein DUF1828 n=1 Tax=Aquabacter spiritensis TaxID=933073 RepID=A0A4R3LX56_9HYPH|nr:DUF1828 domain-containing protein [Aquabacter spiritensis]TCT05220.1 uncharacterized protein DUF1828 [Aquabacter spiritensis]